MPEDISSFKATNLEIYFQSARANVGGKKPLEHLVEFINSARSSLDCAIYDLRDPDVLDALKAASNKIRLRIAYDVGKKNQLHGERLLTRNPLAPNKIWTSMV